MRQQRQKQNLLIRLFNSKLMFPFFLCIWFLYFTYARSQTKSLRGATSSSFNVNEVYKEDEKGSDVRIENLIVVAGHAVVRLNNLAIADVSDAGWYLLPYQRNQGFPAIISSHISMGLKLAASDKRSLLVFSGGQTRKDVGPTSEAASYYYVASHKKWNSNVLTRSFLEEYARDSFENLLFSICRFREIQGYYPQKITVVGFDFKGKRYTDLHRQAIGWPQSNFTYIGMHSPPEFNQERAVQGEINAAKSFVNDMYGCQDPSLSAKRNSRNPFYRTVPYTLACPEMAELLKWCGPGLFDTNSLPWQIKKNLDTPTLPL